MPVQVRIKSWHCLAFMSVFPDYEQWALSVISISDSQVCLLLSTIIHYKKEGGLQPPHGHPTSLCSHDGDSMDKTGLAHPHWLFIPLPYSMEVFNQQWERQEGYRYTTRVSWCWTQSFPYGKDYSSKDHLHTLEVCPMSVARDAHCITSYPIVLYHILSSLLFSVCLFGLIFACLLPAHSDFPMYVNLHGHSVHESLGVLFLLPWLFALPISMKVYWDPAEPLSVCLWSSLTHPPFVSLVLLQI